MSIFGLFGTLQLWRGLMEDHHMQGANGRKAVTAAASGAGAVQPPPTPQQQSPSVHFTNSDGAYSTASFAASTAAHSALRLASPAAHRMADGFARTATLPSPGHASATAAAEPALDPADQSPATAPPPGYRAYYPLQNAVLTSGPFLHQPEPADATTAAATEPAHGSADRLAAAPARIAYNPIKPRALPHEARPQHFMPADTSSGARADPAYATAVEVAAPSRAYNPLDAAMLTRRSQPQQSMPAIASSAAVAGSVSEASDTSGSLPPMPMNSVYNPLRAALPISKSPHSAAEPRPTQETADESAAVPLQRSTRAYNPLALETAAPTFGLEPHQSMPTIGVTAEPMHGAGAEFGSMAAMPEYQARDIQTACRGYYPPADVAREALALPSAAVPRLYRPMVHGQHAQHGGAAH